MNTCRRFGAVLLGALLGVVAPFAGAATLPSGFAETRLAHSLAQPSAMEIAPDGRIFLLESTTGKVRIIEHDVLLPDPFVTLTVDTHQERGLLGIAFDPDFATNNYVYFYYTAMQPEVTTTHNRVVRYTANGNTGSNKTPILELDNLTPLNGYHNGGAIHFGGDGKLYVAVGDNGVPANAQVLTNRFGKILRINKDGTIPSDNPTSFQSVTGTTSGANRAIWAVGFRNPTTFAVQPGGRIFINDVGQDEWEEINDGIAGRNYGWNGGTSDGPGTDCTNLTCPLYAYPHGTGADQGLAINGGAFYNPPNIVQFPASYVGDYFFADHGNGWIKVRDSITGSVSNFATGIARPVDIKVARDGTLYYLSHGSDDPNEISNTGAIFRVHYTGNQAPWISIHPVDTIGTIDYSVTFSVAASGEAPLTYQWEKNGVPIPDSSSPTYTLWPVLQSDNGARFRCLVRTPNSGGLYSNPAILTVTGNQPPVPVITKPLRGSAYNGGAGISFAGSATDPEGGIIPASAFTWIIRAGHHDHLHSMDTISGTKSGTFFTSKVFEAAETDVFYRIYLRVTDSGGAQSTTFVDILPNISNFTVASVPSGLQVSVNDVPYTTPVTFPSVVGNNHRLSTPAIQTLGGTNYQFSSWSNSGTIAQTVAVPSSPFTYTANFTSIGSFPPEANILQDGVAILDGGISEFEGTDVATGSTIVTYTIQNTGSSPLSVGTVGVTGANASNFTVTAQPASSVAGSSSTTFKVKFDPSAAGVRTASLSFSTGDSDENPYNFNIKGNGEVVVDNDDLSGVTQNGSWTQSSATGSSFGGNYLHDGGGTVKSLKSVRFTPTLPSAGAYEVFARWTSGPNRSDNVLMDVVSAGGTATVPVNQQASNGIWRPLGIYTFASSGGSVLIRNDNTNGYYVIADAVKFVPTPATLTLECESLVTTVSGATEADFNDTLCSAGAGNKLAADGVNDYVQYEVNVPSAGVWTISLKVKKYDTRGKFRLFLPQSSSFVGTEQDQFSGSAAYATLNLGSYNFTSAGVKQFRFVVTGKNSLNTSTFNDLGNDAIILSR